MIHTLWFVLLGVMLAGYAVLDGFDLGVGMLNLIVGRNRVERTTIIGAIGPVWNGNEVWLIGAGGAMFVAFPTFYATGFSGFYLALMLVLWLLILRGLSIEFRHQLDHPMWQDAWDVVFCFASALLAFLFGVAIGNVLRGVPLDTDGHFQGSFALMLNPFALLGGVLSVFTLAMHGAGWLSVKTRGVIRDRARAWQRRLFPAVVVTLAAFVVASFFVQPGFTKNFTAMPALMLVPALNIISLVALMRFSGRDDAKAFIASATVVATTLGSAAAGLYPRLLPALAGSRHGDLDIYNSASPDGSLKIAFAIYVIGMAIVATYLVRIYRVWRGEAETY